MRLPSEPGGASGPTAATSPKPTAWVGVRAVLAFTRVLGGLGGRPGKTGVLDRPLRSSYSRKPTTIPRKNNERRKS
jgi:hypothetical protein